MNGGTLTVNSEMLVYMGRENGSSGNITLNGGTFTAAHIHKGGNGGTITFDGGTLKANATYGDNGGIIQNDTGIEVVVAENGGTIDTGGYNVTYGKNTTTKSGVASDGGMKFQGGGSVTVTGDASNPRLSYNGRTTVEVGTTLYVPTATIGGGFAATIPSGLAEGIYKIVEITGDAAFPDDVLANSELPSDPKARFFLSSDKKAIYCAYFDSTDKSVWTGVKDSNLLDSDNWLGGVPTAENGRAAIIGIAEPATFVCPPGFSPVSITFPAGSAKVTIEGEGEISGIAAITNLSNASHEFKVPVSGGTVDLVNVSMYCTFTGGFTVVNPVLTNSPLSNSARGMSGDWTITGEGYVTVPYCRVQTDSTVYVTAPMGNGALENLLVSTNATFRAAIVTLPANGVVQSDYIQIGYNNYGTVVFDEVVAESDSAMTRLAFSQAAPGVLRIGKFTNNAKQHVRLNDLTFVMGAGGFVYGNDSSAGTSDWYSFMVGAGADATIWPSADYTIGLNGNDSRDPKSSSNERRDFGIGYTGTDDSVLTLQTSDYDNRNVPRKVTIDGVIYSNNSSGIRGKMRVCGCGEVLFNSYSRFGKGITVEDTATLSVNAGCAPGKGDVTMNSGATLSLPEKGSVTLCGNLALAAGSKLAFAISGVGDSPKVAMASDKTVDVSGVTAENPVKVSFSTPGGSKIHSFEPYVLIQGAGLAAGDLEKFALADNQPAWVDRLAVVDGDLVLVAKAPGLSISVR